MQVILLERVEKLGQMGQTVSVKPGYARNFLLPKRKALRATESNLKHFEVQRVQLEAHNLKLRSEAEQVAQKMANLIAIAAGNVKMIKPDPNNDACFFEKDGRRILINNGDLVTNGLDSWEKVNQTLLNK